VRTSPTVSTATQKDGEGQETSRSGWFPSILIGADHEKWDSATADGGANASPRSVASTAAPAVFLIGAVTTARRGGCGLACSEEMVKLDYLYIANWSVWADLKLMLRTVSVVFKRRGM
jgi:Bacterial sugar transferase